MQPTQNIPTIMVGFGATGDLMKVKVIPALNELHVARALPTMFRFMGFARRAWSAEEFQQYIREVVVAYKSDADETSVASFLQLFLFESGEFSDPTSYDQLKASLDALDASWGVCSNKIFYLAVAPEFYDPIVRDLSRSGLADGCGPYEGWTRLVVEKPFGEDSESAAELETLLAQFFKEEQIYRIDHYLAKEMLEKFLDFRLSSDAFDKAWDAEHIESIHIKLLENLGAEKRGAFYDKVGALRDVGQNHFMQIIALLAMERPSARTGDAIRSRRARLLEELAVITPLEVPHATSRAQYNGFRDITGVAPDSITETYFKIKASLTGERWAGVPITLEGGKRLGEPLKEIVIRFKNSPPEVLPPGATIHNSVLTIPVEVPDKTSQYTAEYMRLLVDVINGDQTRFVSRAEVVAEWRFIDPIERVWKEGVEKVPLHHYTPDTKEIVEAAKLA